MSQASRLNEGGRMIKIPSLEMLCWQDQGMIIFEISGFDYVGLNPKSIDYGPLKAENR